ncbi:RidA family protein [Marinomonas mediterranea]|jgi:endoribonuclease L-PSP, putative|uniref:Endoribonuclease L-PSP n=1 Tax=Marinomonas mediterranea (strain ATCC 700492 / JCM 21426 / NBRC 103028 / MMB-1) TaxID=717774 RepID=F2K0Y0_MARM1|nr:RidA family protein [Marinomonas mediterranea]ADZ93329.1 endoribonuclease L-PSP [Marinomonas mediterranea MMB-1]WCN11218.1 RidA family protein [Marinomonas mediterranea]WCN15280.1 RidA family protein [Marinomonas mediterranea]WCN19326.1 RidA family protein [Marinomonas mediterranea MMB-1]
MAKKVIHTENAPAAIGPYSQAVQAGNTIYLSGQIPLVPETMEIVEGGVEEQTAQVFKNIQAVCEAAGGTLKDIVKLNIYMTDLGNFAKVNEVMTQFFEQPYPARAALGVRALPKDVAVEIEGIVVLED